MSARPRLLDLFSGAGGAARGYQLAGFHVTGVDIKGQPRYAGDVFVQGDAMTFPLDGFDAIHASPPCQAYSVLRRANPEAEYPDLIALTRERLVASGMPFVIENVVGAPVRTVLMLCGSMFALGSGARQLRRHRLFEMSVLCFQPACRHAGEAIGVYGGGPMGRYAFGNRAALDPHARRGGYQGRAEEKREAMDIDWMRANELNQAIPPAYTSFIGRQLLAAIEATP